MKYKNKETGRVVEAEQFTDPVNLPESVLVNRDGRFMIFNPLLRNLFPIDLSDWILCPVDTQEIYSMTDDEFKRRYAPPVSQTIYDEIKKERERQRLQWSAEHDKFHTPLNWLSLFMKQLGDMSKAYWDDDDDEDNFSPQFLEAGLQLAALIVAMFEARNGTQET